MKTKLLRKLRKEAKEKFAIGKYGDGFCINCNIHTIIRLDPIPTIEEAVSELIKERRKYVIDYVKKQRNIEYINKINEKHYNEI